MTTAVRAVAALGLLCASIAGAGCAEIHAQPMDAARRASIRAVYVVPMPEEDRGIADLFVADLKARGLEVVQGLDDRADIAAAKSDAVLRYQAKWWWDITPYLLSLDAQLRDPSTRGVLATAQSYRPSLQRVEPATMVREVNDALFGASPPRR